MSVWTQVFTIVVGTEGGFTADPRDSGNWTGGSVGAGRLVGTKFGISAADYPSLDIPNLTLEQAEDIYENDYWAKVQGDALPPALALIVFDGAVNSGVSASARWLQEALGFSEQYEQDGRTIDGDVGDVTLAAVQAWSGAPWELCAEVLARRAVTLATDPTFPTFGLGWSRRLARLAFQAQALLPQNGSSPQESEK